MEDFYVRSVSENQAYWAEAAIDARFESGDQSVWNEVYQAPLNRRQLFGFNRIRRLEHMIDGHQRQNRKSIICAPVESSDQQTADQFTKLLMHVNQQEHMLDTISDAFHGALISGMNLLQVWVDYSRDPINGDIKLDNRSYNTFLMDPFFKKADLSDCNGLWTRSYLTHGQSAALLPEFADDILQLPSGTLTDGRFAFMPEARNLMAKNLLAYDEYYYRSYRKQKMLVDTQTGEVMEWRSADEDSLRAFLQAYPQVIVKDQTVATVSLAVVLQGKVFYNDINPLGDSYPFVPVFAYFRPDLSGMSARVQSVTRGLRDAQYLYNRRRLIELDMLEATVTGGIMMKEGSLVDPSQAYITGQGRVLTLKQGAEMSDVQQMQPPQIPPSMMQMSEILAGEIQQIVGISEESLGMSDDKIAGLLAMVRQRAGMATLQGLFDNLDRAKKILGNLMVNIIQNNFTPGKVKRILSEEPTQEFYNKNFGKYDCAIEEGADTTTQKALAFAQLIQLREIGVAIPDATLIDGCTLQNKNDLIKAIDEQSKVQQQQAQQQQELQNAELQMRTELSKARVAEQMALATERNAKAQLDYASIEERQQEAAKDYEQAHLNKLKSLSVLEDMDLTKLQRLIEISKMLEEPEATSAPVKVTKPTKIA
jgi:hypothetical protein